MEMVLLEGGAMIQKRGAILAENNQTRQKIAGVNKKPKKFKTVWHGFRGILKLSGRVNQASLKLSAGFSNTVC